jgi:hypothetical protein
VPLYAPLNESKSTGAKHRQSFTATANPSKLTGANLSAMGGESGWDEQGARSRIMEALASNEIVARDIPPHLLYPRGGSIVHQASREQDDSVRKLYPEKRRQASRYDPNSRKVDNKENQGTVSSNNEYLLAAIARMERENRGFLP